MRKILVTSALIYANGPLHLGHILELIQTDIWVRFQKLQGNSCIYISGSDAHGTPIMIAAQKKGIKPEKLVEEINLIHKKEATSFLVNFDNFYTTHSPENLELTNEVYHKLLKNNDLEKKVIEQAYDNKIKMFLPDRYIIGTCPKCGAIDQNSDNCEKCGSIYTQNELLNPISIFSKEKPIKKSSQHIFFKLNKYSNFLKIWGKNRLQPEISNKLNEWFQQGLKSWDISRDDPYFGFPIPNNDMKYFYVWLDAPLGYISIFKNICEKNKINFDDYWKQNDTTELYHFIGKDIAYFHALFWPAILMSAGFRQPTSIYVHGYLTINKQKMSKSKNTFILASEYLKSLDPEFLRYYFATKLNANIDDIDLNFNDLIGRINTDLIGKIINIASRTSHFLNNSFDNQLSATIDDQVLINVGISISEEIKIAYEQRNYSTVIKKVLEVADITNKYINEKKPWLLSKQNTKNIDIQKICTTSINMYRFISIFLKPILPIFATKSEKFLNIPSNTAWKDINQILLNHKINQFNSIMSRVDIKNNVL